MESQEPESHKSQSSAAACRSTPTREPYPSYLRLYENGELGRRARRLLDLLEDCTVCPHQCHVNRKKEERGFCQATAEPEIASYGPHFGEEEPLVGSHGSGTIFFSHCNLRCVFCQNYEISRAWDAERVSLEELASIMVSLQARGCHNINLVTPSHYVPQIVGALEIAVGKGLHTPLVYNSGGYDAVDTLKLLDGIVDIYMPDFKYASGEVSRKYSGVRDYPEVARLAIKEMHRQVGDLVIDEEGIARRGLIIRHLVLPHGLAGTKEVMEFIAKEISPRSYVNLMAQYYPAFKAYQYPEIARRISRKEFEEALWIAREASEEFRLA